MKMKIPIELPNGARATLTVDLSMTTNQKRYAMDALGLTSEEIDNALGQEFRAYAEFLGADESQLP